MTSLSSRYLAGDREEVWTEIRLMGEVRIHHAHDVRSVATETMRRFGRHVDRLADAYAEAGLVSTIPIRTPATDEDRQELARLESEIGPLPAALRACMTEVGGVWLAGDCAKLGLFYDEREPQPAAPVHPDPLVLPDARWLRYEWTEFCDDDERDPDEAFWFAFAPDEHHKANISGSTQLIALPQPVGDPVLEGVRQLRGRDVSLVEYLRLSVAWAGCAGWSLAPESMPAALEPLRVSPDF
ncbi:hypothetical protein F4553_001627 [Allocatelliglobosispora scoriae]|uniref:Uncharacterized protein n=1 Tax=Allocatelliglobosispora scoriae TaxID=643052 RepID=A0A841BLK9_9ACTN|nr:SMI1/KNR4 family protein [Allocatelliglobosispora scoriae]MBB5868248.1 hypothetical protein [Allocatelliglobosispora scoriae]